MTGMSRKTNADSLLITKGLWASITGFARAVASWSDGWRVSTVRKAFLGRGDIPGMSRSVRLARSAAPSAGIRKPRRRSDAGALWWYGCNLWAPNEAPVVDPRVLKRRAA